MAGATLLVCALTIFSLYLAALDQFRLHLIDSVDAQARMIAPLGRIAAHTGSAGSPPPSEELSLEKILETHPEFGGFGQTGEFVLARRDDDQIRFILNRPGVETEIPHPIPFNGDWAEPMRRALSGGSGTLVGTDYRGVQVLAAYRWVPAIEAGLVAKMDMEEIRQPFIRAGLLAVFGAALVVFLASRLFFRVSRPIQRAIDRQAETFRTLAETSLEGILLADTRGTIEFANRAALDLFGYRHGELIGQNIKILMPPEHRAAHDGYIKRYLETGLSRIIGRGRQLTAIRKDGSRFPIHLSLGDIRTDETRLFAGVIMDISEQKRLEREILEIPVSEQRRIGQELHDGLGQQLTGLGLLATSLLNKASKPEHELATRLAEGLQEAIAQVRALSRGLMPVAVDAAGLIAALENLVDNVRASSDTAIQVSISHQVHITDNFVAMHLYRLAQESINNAIKHADAEHITVTLGQDGTRGFLSVRDDGSGMQFPASDPNGLGMRIMKHRCGLIDADLTIESSPDEGTEVTCRFPIDDELSYKT